METAAAAATSSVESAAQARIAAAEVVENLLAKACSRGERSVALARAGVCGLVLVRVFTFGREGLMAGGANQISSLVLATIGIIASLAIIRVVDSVRQRPWMVTASVLLDATIAGYALLAEALWPLPKYAGAFLAPQYGLVLVAVIAAALRFSVSRVVASFALCSTMMVGTFLFELLYRPQIHYEPERLATSVIFYAGGAVISLLITRRVRRLLRDGTEAVLSAERARQRLGAYVSEAVATEALAKDELQLGGDRREVAILFSDLRGFTRYAEKMSPERLVAEINAYLDAMVRAIRAEEGVIDKFIGDSIMVVFGVPSAMPDAAARAIRTARAMQRALAAHNTERRERGLPSLVQGIGVHYGAAVVGHIGTRERLQFTVMGDVVNLASRIESATKEHNVHVLISAAAVESAQASTAGTGAKLPMVQRYGSIEVRGREEEIELYCFPDDGFSSGTSVVTGENVPLGSKA